MAKTSRSRPPAKPRRHRYRIDYKLSPIAILLPGAFVYAESLDEARESAVARAMRLEEMLNQTGLLASILQFDPVVTSPEEDSAGAPSSSSSGVEAADAT